MAKDGELDKFTSTPSGTPGGIAIDVNLVRRTDPGD
jgi:hypothetical protein